ncbi:hypothetical protein INT45_014117 [Circinella minor]|uniref:Uncharacterized protein n=1 Tax=Circinella minor TaxID=1195481 RepID=A0A8H7S3V3_9FUNG|nr:hypothetical protein INT45_014117 [Circinella minor]
MVEQYPATCPIPHQSLHNSAEKLAFSDPAKSIATTSERNNDKTIQLLCTVAQHIYGDVLKKNDIMITAENLHEIHN